MTMAEPASPAALLCVLGFCSIDFTLHTMLPIQLPNFFALLILGSIAAVGGGKLESLATGLRGVGWVHICSS